MITQCRVSVYLTLMVVHFYLYFSGVGILNRYSLYRHLEAVYINTVCTICTYTYMHTHYTYIIIYLYKYTRV